MKVKAVCVWKTYLSLDAPNFYTYNAGVPYLTPENAAKYPPPAAAWTPFIGMRPASRGSIHLTGAEAPDQVRVDANYLSDPRDLRDLILEVLRAHESEMRRNEAQEPLRTKRTLSAHPDSGAAERACRWAC